MTRLRSVPVAPRRAVGYVRVSMAREEMISPELQRAAIESYCAQRGYVLAEVIEDLDQTGRNFARAGVQAAIGEVEAGRADVIVVWKVSRFGRNTRDWHVHADRVEVAGGSLESATEAFDPRTSTGKLTRGMLVELAAWESNVKSEQWREAQAHRLRAGRPHSPTPRFGYRYDPETDLHVPDPTEAPMLAEAYARFIRGESYRRVADWLNSMGARTVRGNRWEPTALARTLKSGFAAGLLSSGGEHLPGAHEAVITEQTWARFERQRALMAGLPARTRQAAYPLTGLVRCARCGRPMYHWRSGGHADGRRYPSYVCRRQDANSCGRNYVGEPQLHEGVKAWLAAEVAADLDQRTASKAQRLAARTLAQSERTQVERKIRDLDKSMARLAEAFARGTTPRVAYDAAMAALAEERAGLEARLVVALDDADAVRADHRPLARKILRDYDALIAADPAGMREVFRRLLDCVLIEPGRHDTATKVRVVPRWTAQGPGQIQ